MLHRIDPPVHLPNKGHKRKAAGQEEPGTKIRLQSSSRKAPNVIEGYGEDTIAMRKKGGTKRKNGSYEIRPNQALIERVRYKQAKRKAEEDADLLKPTKAVCERDERIAEVQLKAYWACFPLGSSSDDASSQSKEGKAPGGNEDVATAAPKEQTRKGRKQLFASLKASIVENGIKRRKIDDAQVQKLLQLGTMHAALPEQNSSTGKDQRDFNPGTKVGISGDDLSKNEFSRMGVQHSFNKGPNVEAVAASALGNASNKREAQSIMNLIQAGKAKVTKTKS